MKKYPSLLFLSIICLMLCSAFCFGQKTDDTASRIESEQEFAEADNLPGPGADTSLERFAFDSSFDSVRVYKSRQDFKYMRYLDSLLKKTKGLTVDTISLSNIKGVKSKPRLNRSSGSENYNISTGPFVKVLLWILAIFFIGFILYKLFLTESIFKKAPRNYNNPIQQQEETVITPSGYEGMINDAIINKDFRLAIRYLYLQTLQMLSGGGLIQFSPDKTNYEYVKELSGKTHQNEFASLTLNYEYVWYGKFNIDQEIFNRLQKDFKQYHQKI